MRYCRFEVDGVKRYGLVEGAPGAETITRALDAMPRSRDDFAAAAPLEIPLAKVRLLAPSEPSKIVCIGRNYSEHAKELNHPIPSEPLIFLKPPSSLNHPDGEVRRPNHLSQRVDYEGELGVVIGKRCYRLGESDDVRPYILGYTCLNDVTARDLQSKDGQWSRAKGFDTFCCVGPFVVDDIDPWKGVNIETRLNGSIRQSGTTLDFLFPLDVVMRFISQVMTLEPGDLIATGTPSGVGPMQPGDVVEVSVEGIGTLRNFVVNLA